MTPQIQAKPVTTAPVQTSAKSKAVAVRDTRDELQSFIQGEKLRGEMVKVLPKNLTPERMARIAWTAIVRNPALADCDRASLATAIILCAQAGLEPDGRMAHLIPFGKTVQVIFDYKGLVALAKRNGVDMRASLVCANDDFRFQEDDGSGKTVVEHSFNVFEERGEIIGVYSRAIEPGKSPDYEFMPIAEVESVRSRSRAGKNGPWVTDYGEMVKKTVLKRHSKRIDLMPEVRDVINAEDDTPAAIDKPVFTKPLFKALPGPQTEPEPPEMPQGAKSDVPQAQNAPKGQPEAKETILQPIPKPSDQAVNVVKSLLKASKIKETELIGFLIDIGLAEPGTANLEELDLQSDVALGTIAEQWQDFAQRITENRDPAPE